MASIAARAAVLADLEIVYQRRARFDDRIGDAVDALRRGCRARGHVELGLKAKNRLDIVKTAVEWLQLPHWLMIAGTLLVIAGLIGLVISRRQQAKVQDLKAGDELSASFREPPEFVRSGNRWGR